MSNSKAAVVIGQICAPYGVKGWVHVRSFTEPQSNLENFAAWQLAIPGKDANRIVQVEQFKTHSNHFVAKLADIADRDAAAAITNCHITVAREALPALDADEYYLADLVGLQVRNTEGIVLGTVTDFLETGAHDVLIVTGEKEYLIPCVVGEHLLQVCFETNEIEVAWDTEF